MALHFYRYAQYDDEQEKEIRADHAGPTVSRSSSRPCFPFRWPRERGGERSRKESMIGANGTNNLNGARRHTVTHTHSLPPARFRSPFAGRCLRNWKQGQALVGHGGCSDGRFIEGSVARSRCDAVERGFTIEFWFISSVYRCPVPGA